MATRLSARLTAASLRSTGAPAGPPQGGCYGWRQSTSFNDPSGEAEKEVWSLVVTTDRELMSAADVGRTVSRIAHQIIEKTALDEGCADAPRVVLLGIPTRGVTLANRLAARIVEFCGVTVARGGLDITLYRDDLDFKPPRALEETSIPAGGIDGALVILVDDVLYTGRSVRSALDALRDIGRPTAVQLAVLVDRGHRELPLRADYVGKNVPPSRAENVKVRLTEDDGVEGIWIAPEGGPAR
jgi:pyrimidine operon attenuation protein/uracil phosphoribosyltransferase